jgi:hypothetical protein
MYKGGKRTTVVNVQRWMYSSAKRTFVEPKQWLQNVSHVRIGNSDAIQPEEAQETELGQNDLECKLCGVESNKRDIHNPYNE